MNARRWPKTPTVAALVWLCLAMLAWCSLPAQAKQVAVPAMKSRVVDLANTLKAGEAEALRGDIATLQAGTQAQLAVLIVPTTGEDTIEQYATRVFAQWKLGREEEDDGVLLLVALKDRKMRIEVGTGLEGTVTDIQAARIIDREMTPRFRNGDFAGGIQAAVGALSRLIDPPALKPPADATGDPLPFDTPSGAVTETTPEPVSLGSHVTPEGWALFGVLLWSLAVGGWYGRGAAANARGRAAVQQAPRKNKGVGKLAGKGKLRRGPEPWSDAVAAIAPAPFEAPKAPTHKPDWRVALGLVGAGLVGGAVALSNPVMVLGLAMPAAFFYGIGYGCGRSRAMLYVVGGIALAVAGLVALAFTLGAERFWWGFLWALGDRWRPGVLDGHRAVHAPGVAARAAGLCGAPAGRAGRGRLRVPRQRTRAGSGPGLAARGNRQLRRAAVRFSSLGQHGERRQRRQRQRLEQLVEQQLFQQFLVVVQRRRFQQRRRRVGQLVAPVLRRGSQRSLNTPSM
jgi:uncharacterized protein